MILSRFLASFLLMVLTAGQIESGVSLIFDGEVHHESAVTALDHAGMGGEHGHEDSDAPTHPHDDDHQHGTSADHCTHAHGVAVLAQSASTGGAAQGDASIVVYPCLFSDVSLHLLTRPPIA